jgi:hypothetical protein
MALFKRILLTKGGTMQELTQDAVRLLELLRRQEEWTKGMPDMGVIEAILCDRVTANAQKAEAMRKLAEEAQCHSHYTDLSIAR